MANEEIHGGELHYGDQVLRFTGEQQLQTVLNAMDAAGKAGFRVLHLDDDLGFSWNLLLTGGVPVSVKTIHKTEGLGVY